MKLETASESKTYYADVTIVPIDDPQGHASLGERLVRFGPTGWLTVGSVDGKTRDVFPLARVIAVENLRAAVGEPAPVEARTGVVY